MRRGSTGTSRRTERGVVAPLVALMTFFLLVMAAFTVDFGLVYAQKAALQTGADSGALAVARAKYTAQVKSPSQTCQQLVAADAALPASDPAKAANVALKQVNANAPFGQALPGTDVTTALSCIQPATGATCAATDPLCVLQVNVTPSKSVPRVLGGLVGSRPYAIDKTSRVALGVRNNVVGAMPLALCQQQVQSIIDRAAVDAAAGVPYRAETVAPSKVWSTGTCDGAGGAGNWGWLDLGQGNGANALGDMIASGGSTEVLTLTGNPPSLSLDGTPGNKGNSANVHSGMAMIMDKVVLLPVYDTYSENGANAHYNIVGFLTVKMCGYDNAERGACADPAVPMTSNSLQVRFVDYSPVGKIGNVCGIGQACAFDSYVVGLVK